MNIKDMHILFRTIGQQMGIQQVRGILPESIDNFLNAAIVEKCRSILIENTSTPQQELITQRNNYVSVVNALRTLYRVKKYYINDAQNNDINNPYDINIVSQGNLNPDDVFEIISFTCKIDNKIKDCRLIEHDRIANVLNDYCNRPSDDYPAITLNSRTTNTNNINIVGTIYIDDYSKLTELICNYIQTPAKVNYENNVNCDLPDYLHSEVVQLAVNKFFTSVGSTTHNVKQ